MLSRSVRRNSQGRVGMKEFFHAKVQFFLVESVRQRLLACIGGSQREGCEHWS